MKKIIKKDVKEDKVKVPHIGPRPRSSGPGTTIVGSKKKPTKVLRKK